MGLLDSLRSARSGGAAAVHVTREQRLLDGSQGDALWVSGFTPVDQAGGALGGDAHRTSDKRVYHCQVAGVHQWPSALLDDRFELGSTIVLKAEQGGVAYGGYEVGVWDARSSLQVGFLPNTLGGTVAGMMRAGRSFSGEVMRELRLGSPDGRRVALHVLVSAVPFRMVIHGEPGSDQRAR